MVDEFIDTLICHFVLQKHSQMGLVNESVPKFRIPQRQMRNPTPIIPIYQMIIGPGL